MKFILALCVCTLGLTTVACGHSPEPTPKPAPQATQGDMPPPGKAVPTLDRGKLVALDEDDESLVAGETLEQAAREYTDELERMFAGLTDEMNQCYLPQLKRDPSLKGYISIKFQVKPGGVLAQDPTIGPSTLRNEHIEACLIDLIKAQTYPEPYNGTYTDVDRAFHFGEF